MTKSRPPALRGLDALLEKQALETATDRAARDERRAQSGEDTPKRYRLGPDNPDGTIAIDVADRDSENWRQREMCPSLEHAKARLRELIAADSKKFGPASEPDR
jgi:hypothetical protein